MSFINNLIERSTAAATDIQPRLRGKFERSAAPAESIEEVAMGTPSPLKDETVTGPKTTELITRKMLIEERAEKIYSRVTEKTRDQISEQPIPEIKSEKQPRFQPSYTLVAQAPVNKKNTQEITNVQEHPDRTTNFIQHNNETIHQHVHEKPAIAPSPSIITKEIQKPIPAAKPTGNNILRIEPQQKTQQKQSPAASFIQRNTVKSEPSRTINISIGKIEVRVQQPPVQHTARPKKEGMPIMSLDEYLQKRNQRSQ